MCTTFTLFFLRPHTLVKHIFPHSIQGGPTNLVSVGMCCWEFESDIATHVCGMLQRLLHYTPSGIFHLILSFPPRFFALSFSFPLPRPLISLFLLRFISYSFFPSVSLVLIFSSVFLFPYVLSHPLFFISLIPYLSVFFQLSFLEPYPYFWPSSSTCHISSFFNPSSFYHYSFHLSLYCSFFLSLLHVFQHLILFLKYLIIVNLFLL